MKPAETQPRRLGLPMLVAIVASCLISALVGGLIVAKMGVGKAAAPVSAAADSPDEAPAAARDDEVRRLRNDVARLSRAVGTMATSLPAQAKAGQAPAPPRPEPPPEVVRQTDYVQRFQTGTPDPQKTRTLETSLAERLKKPAFASAQIRVEEVDCRGAVCRARVSLAEDAAPEAVVAEMATLLPDSHSFQEASSAGGNRRMITSHFIDDSAGAAPRPPLPGSGAR